MHPISQPGKIVFEFDNWRGGFLLQLSRITEQDVHPLFGNLICASSTSKMDALRRSRALGNAADCR